MCALKAKLIQFIQLLKTIVKTWLKIHKASPSDVHYFFLGKTFNIRLLCIAQFKTNISKVVKVKRDQTS